MNTLKFSVITTSYNQGKYIERTINSVLKQNYSNFEHIIIDGGSTDETISILKRFPHLKWVSEKDNGQSGALNKGFHAATGDVIAWLNSDDTYCPEAFHTVNNYLQQFKDRHVIYGDFNVIDENDKFIKFMKCKDTSLSKMLKQGSSTVGQPALFFKRFIIDKVGLLDENLHLSMDYEYFLRMIIHYNFYYLNKTLANFRKHNASKTLTSMKKSINVSYEISKKYGGNRYLSLHFNILFKKIFYHFPSLSIQINNLRYSLNRKIKKIN
jgi:glycosyltransferase involved in cell wall biosynthesis